MYGPLVLAAEDDLVGDHRAVRSVALPGPDLTGLGVEPEVAVGGLKTWDGARVFRVNAISRRAHPGGAAVAGFPIRMVPFADAGTTGVDYKVWLPVGSTTGNLFLEEKEDRSRRGNVAGSITDGDPGSFVVTFNNKAATEDWFSVTLEAPAELRRVVFHHGKTFHDGGWFDVAAGGVPRVQIQSVKGGGWETVGALKDYPATTATNPAGLTAAERFVCKLPQPVNAVAVRVIGKPASGDNPAQAFSSCGELMGE